MQNEMKFSLLVWENISNIPFPEDVKPLLEKIDWSKHEWQAVGLPLSFATYSLSDGKQLYLQELSDGTTKVEKQDFTGDLVVGSYFVNEDKEGNNYFILLNVTIFKGEVKEVTVKEKIVHPNKVLQDSMAHFQAHVSKTIRIHNSWWFKWLYKPYWYVVRGIGFGLHLLLKLLGYLVYRIVSFLTPLS